MNRRSALARLGTTAALAAIPVPRMGRVLAGAAPADRDADFERLLRLASVPSMAWAVVEGDRVTTRALGVRRTGEPERVTTDTVYAAASLTKLVVAYLVHALASERALSLDRPVGEYLPLPNPDDARARLITARHLLSHSGGWRNWRNDLRTPLVADFEPGARWQYSGEGFFFMQRILEKLSGKAIGQLARERVFAPLGMTRSSLVALEELEPFQAPGHNGRGEPATVYGRSITLELRKRARERGTSLEAATADDVEQALKAAEPNLPALPNYFPVNGAASMLTTANDFGALMKHLVTAPRLGGPAAAIVRQMMTAQVRCNEAVSWGLGVGLEEADGRTWAWQWGDNSGFKAFYLLNPDGERAIAVFTNGDRGARVYERVIRTLMNTDHPAFLFA